MTQPLRGNVRPVKIEEEMRASYLDYAMSVIVSRALPDVRDGLKPVQRRILYAMDELGFRPGTPYRKSARIVGEVLGKYHPHSDEPVYESMVRMAQDFTMRYPLIDGQGNFGSIDNDPPAAMRYTEARLAPIAMEMLADIDKNTVDFIANFDDSLVEPIPLPARLPNLLVNGASGIAVGMATNIPPHNLREVCDAIIYLIDHPDATADDLSRIVLGPDFPTGGIIYRMHRDTELDAEGRRREVMRDAIKDAYAKGRGRITVQARSHIEEIGRTGRYQIVVTELPYQTNKAALVEKIADLVRDRRLDGISDLRDESDRQGMRVVIELRRDAQPQQVLNYLYKHTAMRSTFAVNMLALADGQPQTLRLREMIEHFIAFRRVVIRRRTEYDLEKARERAHILEGLLKAISMLDRVIATIRGSASADEARQALMARPFNLSERQAQAVLDMQLRRLAALERQKIQDEYDELMALIRSLEELLADPAKIDAAIKNETEELKRKYGDDRRTRIVEQQAEELSLEDLIPHQDVIVTLSQRNYIKRMPLETYRSQRRGGRGITGMVTREDDAVRHLVIADTHDSLLFFTNRGRVFQLTAHEIEEVSSRQGRGRPLTNFISIDQGEAVTAVVTVSDFDRDYMVLATRQGEVKKTPLSEFTSVRSNGIIAMGLEGNDELIAAVPAAEDDELILVTASGQAIRFPVSELRAASRTSGGVRGIRLEADDRVIAADIAKGDGQLLVVSEKGYGKRTALTEYPTHHRGGGGVITFRPSARTGLLAAATVVDDQHELLIISGDGIMLRTSVKYERRLRADGSAVTSGIPIHGRSGQGIRLMDLGAGDSVAALACVDSNGRTSGSGESTKK